jgi:FkbM family methyltransferase
MAEMKTSGDGCNASNGGLGRFGVFVARHRKSRVARKIAALCREYLRWFANANYDIRSNGEYFVLDALAPFRLGTIFDVGANVGDWCVTVKSRFPGAAVHAFEIAPRTFEQLSKNVARLDGVRCVPAGMSDAEGRVAIRYYPDLPVLTTAIDYQHPFRFEEVEAAVTTGDEYLAREGIEHIDFLKLDVEGMENRVLKGFDRALSEGRVDIVQFEYGQANIVNAFLLRDFHAFFRKRGYVVGKVFPNYVDFRDYSFADEDFLGPNYLACRADKTEYIRALAGQVGPA